jgi:hypothetical protein
MSASEPALSAAEAVLIDIDQSSNTLPSFYHIRSGKSWKSCAPNSVSVILRGSNDSSTAPPNPTLTSPQKASLI